MNFLILPKDYADLNFIRPDIGTQANGLPTCIRFLVYGQNLPVGSSVRIDLFRNFEGIPFPGMADFVTMDFYRSKGVNKSQSGEPAIDAGSKIAENRLTITKANATPSLESFLKNGTDTIYREPEQEDIKAGKPNDKHSLLGSMVDVATGLGKILIGTGVQYTSGMIPFVGPMISAGVDKGLDWAGDKVHNIYA